MLSLDKNLIDGGENHINIKKHLTFDKNLIIITKI